MSMIVTKTLADFEQNRGLATGKVGFVPTMGALHQGHISLLKRSKEECDVSVCSIFVNPIQFTNQEDFSKYPQTLESDLVQLEKTGCDVVFAPSASEMYAQAPTLNFDFGFLEKTLEGTFRPGHFNGVGIVVSKLFHIVQPDVAYFGRKDLQQTLVVKTLVSDLGFPVRIEVCDTLREADGLAMSSRNLRLEPAYREKASFIYARLLDAQEKIQQGRSILEISVMAKHYFKAEKDFELEYFEVVDAQTLQPIHDGFVGEVAICVAAHINKVRLIDNVVFFKAN
jgi:pantoate--beta-alanine ligase